MSLTTAFTRPPSKRLEISHYRSLNALSHCFPHKLCALAVSISQCAAAAKSLQSCPTLCDSIDGSPPGPAVPGILQARTHMWVAISFSNALKWKVKVKSLSRAPLLATPWPMGFSRQEYWSGVPLPSLERDLGQGNWRLLVLLAFRCEWFKLFTHWQEETFEDIKRKQKTMWLDWGSELR